jgi:hypothetical protein
MSDDEGSKMRSQLTRKPKHGDARGARSAKSKVDYLQEHERGAKPAIKFHPKRMTMQAAPDHGDHE